MNLNEAIQLNLSNKIANLERTNSILQVNLQHTNGLLKKAQEELTALKEPITSDKEIGEEHL
jgi:hypothetical protein